MKNNKSLLCGSILSAVALLLSNAIFPKECRKCPVHTKPGIKWIMNPCVNCKMNGGTEPPPEINITVKRRKGG